MIDRTNKVELIGTYGSDELHALSAWTSTSRELTDEKKNRIPEFLKKLVNENHGTPFEKSSLHFLIVADVATMTHLLKHRIGVSVNSESARYKEMRDDKFYVPQDWPEDEIALYTQHMLESYEKYHTCVERLVKKGFSRKRAKESARMYVPYGNQYTADVMFNFRSFYHFLTLRYSTHAQREISDVALKMLTAVKSTGNFDKTLEAFGLVVDGEIRPEFDS